MATDSDDDSVASASPIQQCMFWSLSIAFMLKLGCFVVVAVIIHNNEWVLVEPINFDYSFIRGISFDDCAYMQTRPDDIQCIKWSLVNQTEWYDFWTRHKINPVNVQEPAAWYANAYYICLLLLVWYVLDMGAMLVMCCRQKKLPDSVKYQKQVSCLSMVFIVITYISVYIGLAHSRQTDFVKAQFPATSSLGIGAKLFIGTLIVYILACFIQHAYFLYGHRETFKNPQQIFKNFNWRRLIECFPHRQNNSEANQNETATNRSPNPKRQPQQPTQQFEMTPLRDL